jgi:hypothetical protein
MTSVLFVPEISMKTGDINWRKEIALNLCMHGGSRVTCCNNKERKSRGVSRHVEQ